MRELVDKVKAKFTQPAAQNEVGSLLEEKPVEIRELQEKITKQKELRTRLNTLNSSLDAGNKQQLVADVKQVTHELTELAQQQGAEEKVKEYTAIVDKAAGKITEESSIPFARYLTQVADENALAIRTEDDVLKHLRLIERLFLHETELQSDHLNVASSLVGGILEKNSDQVKDVALSRANAIIAELLDKGASVTDARAQFQNINQRIGAQRQRQADEERMRQIEELRRAQEGGDGNGEDDIRKSRNESKSINSFVDKYKQLEKAILESPLEGDTGAQQRHRRVLLYNLLEIDINHETEQMRGLLKETNNYEDAISRWQANFTEHYRQNFDHVGVTVPDPVREKAMEYAEEFVKFMKIRIDRLKSYYHGMGDRDEYRTRYAMQLPTDLSRFFKGVFDDAYIALAFIDAEGLDNKNNLDIKDIFMRFKLKAALEHERHHDPHHLDHTIFDVSKKTYDINYEEIEHSLLNTFKAPYLSLTRSTLEGIPPTEEFQLVLRKVESLIGGRKFSDSASTFTFLGGTADVEQGEPQALKLRVKSKIFTESAVNPGMFGKGFIESQRYTVSSKHKSLGDLMTDFHEKIRHVQHIAEQAKRMHEAIRDGKPEAIAESARIFGNEVLDSMALESPIILNAMLAYVNTFKATVYAAQGQFRPSLFSVSPEGNESPQDAALKRAVKAVSPDATEDELVVFATIGKALAWGVGDLGRWMARVLPPLEVVMLNEKGKPDKSKIEGLRQAVIDGRLHGKKESDAVFEYLVKLRPSLKSVYFDQYARAFLAQTNPFFHGMMWADTTHEYKVHELLFGGAYTTNPSDYRPGAAGLLNPLRALHEGTSSPFFSRKDTLATPFEIISMADREKESLYMGLDEETFKRRVAGRAPIMLKLTELVGGNTGIGERAGWRMEIRQTESFINQFMRDRGEDRRTEAFTTKEMQTLLDRALILGPYAALEVLKACFDTEGVGASSYVTKETGSKGVFEDYIYKKMYEYFPSIFVGREEMRRHVKRERDIFSSAWYKRLFKELQENPGSELYKLMPNETYFANLQRDEKDMMHLRDIDPKARAIQGILYESQLILESAIMEQRNGIQNYKETIPTLRETLHYLTTTPLSALTPEQRADKRYIVADRLIGYIQQANLLNGDKHELIGIIARNLYQQLYSSHLDSLTIEGSGGQARVSNASQGLADELRFENIGAKKMEDREKLVDVFRFLRDLKDARLAGPVFDFYYENIGDFFSAQLTGDRSSGKEMVNRKYADLGTYIKGMGACMGALNKIADGVKSMNKEDLKKAETAFLAAANEAGGIFESYNTETNRHEVVFNLMLQWIMMGRIPGRQGFDLRFAPHGLPLVRELDWKHKSLAELVGDMGGWVNSSMVYDTQETENFIVEAQQKGYLPIHKEGKTVQTLDKRRQTMFHGAFERFFNNVESQVKAVDSISDEQKREKIKKGLLYKLYEKVDAFGNQPTNLTLTRGDKYEWSAARMMEITGKSLSRDYLQFGVYGMYFVLLLILLAIGRGAAELDIKS